MKYLLATAAILTAVSTTFADSCWTHNGSLMRLDAQGNNRAFMYEAPRPEIWARGAAPGTVLFIGGTDGHVYYGTARFFARCVTLAIHCAIETREYNVAGPVSSNQKQVILYGRTGDPSLDTLVFNYSHQC